MLIDIATALIILHAPGGKEIEINPQMVTSMRRGEKDGSQHFTEDAHCLVSLADGKYVAVRETCNEVRSLVEQAK
jgi:hypothetical protein